MASTSRSDRDTAILGTVLLALYIAQACLGIEWPHLAALQRHERYKVITGSILAADLL